MFPNGPIGIGRIPAQQERITSSTNDRLINAICAIALGVLALADVVTIFLVVGPALFWFLIAALVCVAAYAIICKLPGDDNGLSTGQIVVVGIAALILVGWWTAYAGLEAQWPMIAPHWTLTVFDRTLFDWGFVWPMTSPLAMLVTVAVLLIPLAVMCMIAYAMLVEAYNPAAFQPFQARVEGTPWWTPTGERQERELPDLEDLRAMVQELIENSSKPQVVERLVVMNSAPIGKTNGNGIHTAQDQDTDLRYLFRQWWSGEAQFHAPFKEYAQNDPDLKRLQYVKMSDLVRFIKEAETRTTSWRNWHADYGWSEQYWRQVREVLRRMGIMERSEDRKVSRLSVGKARAMQILASWNTNVDRGTELVEPATPAPVQASAQAETVQPVEELAEPDEA